MKIYHHITKDIIYQDDNVNCMKNLVEQAINKEIDLSYADLYNADLSYADLYNAIGNNKEVKTIQTGRYIVNIINNIDMQIGCQMFEIRDWFDFTDRDIIELDGKEALKWWKQWKPILQAIIKEVK
tara:strand:- start:20 stop:397 length:378 start_codon:yes stop_codon:yes gene_type:complete